MLNNAIPNNYQRKDCIWPSWDGLVYNLTRAKGLDSRWESIDALVSLTDSFILQCYSPASY